MQCSYTRHEWIWRYWSNVRLLISGAGFPTLFNGPYNFTAPAIPAGMQFIQLDVILYNQVCDNDITISFESEILMLMVNNPCAGNSVNCPNNSTIGSRSFDCSSAPKNSLNFWCHQSIWCDDRFIWTRLYLLYTCINYFHIWYLLWSNSSCIGYK